MADANTARRVIQVNKRIIGPAEPRKKTARVRKLGDYAGSVSAAHRAVAKKLSSPLLMGPPICDELIEFVTHTFTEEEAGLVRHLRPVRGRSAASLARAVRRPLAEVEPILTRLAFQKRAIGASGSDGKQRYGLMPIMPGIFEMVLIGESPETMTDWHRRFAELLETLFETGYMLDYQDKPRSMVRFVPHNRAVGGHPAALPSDRLEVILDRYDAFGVGHCQCRMSTAIAGHKCDKPLEVCTVVGQWAERGIEAGWLKRVSKENILEIKRDAERHGLVTWFMNVESAKGQVSCSCCGCCCKAMRMVSDFNAPGMAAPPHFMPRFDFEKCGACGLCAKSCPMGAITVDLGEKTLEHQPARCIGCGLCSIACEKQQAVAMAPVPDYRLPYKSWFAMLRGNVPGMLKSGFSAWRKR